MKNQIVSLLSSNIDVLSSEDISPLIEIPPKPEMGDFAFKEAIGEQSFLSEIKVVGGYLNFYVDKAQYAKQIIDKYLTSKDYGSSDCGNGKTVCIDYSSPNVAILTS